MRAETNTRPEGISGDAQTIPPMAGESRASELTNEDSPEEGCHSSLISERATPMMNRS